MLAALYAFFKRAGVSVPGANRTHDSKLGVQPAGRRLRQAALDAVLGG
jgi:hypothetical protein